MKLQREHSLRKTLIWHANDDAGHAPKLPAPTDHLDGNVLPLENVGNAENRLVFPRHADHQERVPRLAPHHLSHSVGHPAALAASRYQPVTGWRRIGCTSRAIRRTELGTRGYSMKIAPLRLALKPADRLLAVRSIQKWTDAPGLRIRKRIREECA